MEGRMGKEEAMELFLLKCEQFGLNSKELNEIYSQYSSSFAEMKTEMYQVEKMSTTEVCVPLFQTYFYLLIKMGHIYKKQPKIYKIILSSSFSYFCTLFEHTLPIFSTFLQFGEITKIKIILLYFLHIFLEEKTFYETAQTFSPNRPPPKHVVLFPVLVNKLFDISIKNKEVDYIINFYTQYLFHVTKYLIDNEDLLIDVVVHLVDSLNHEKHPDPPPPPIYLFYGSREPNSDPFTEIELEEITNKQFIENNNDSNDEDYQDIDIDLLCDVINMENNYGEKLFYKDTRSLSFALFYLYTILRNKDRFHIGIFKKKKNIRKLMKIGYLSFLPKSSSTFCKLCVDDNIKILKQVIEEFHCPYDYFDLNSIPPIIAACREGNINVVKYLIEKYQMDGKMEQVFYVYRKEMLVECSKFGHLKLLKYLIEEQNFDYKIREEDELKSKKFKLEGEGEEGKYQTFSISGHSDYYPQKTLLSIAVAKGRKEIIDYLLSLNYYQEIFSTKEYRLIKIKNGLSKWESPVLCAMQNQHYDIALQLMDEKISILHENSQTHFIHHLVRISDQILFEKFLSLFTEIDEEYLLEISFYSNFLRLELFQFILNRFQFSSDFLLKTFPQKMFTSDDFFYIHCEKVCFYFEKFPIVVDQFNSKFLSSWCSSFNWVIKSNNYNVVN